MVRTKLHLPPPTRHAGWRGQLRCGLVSFAVQAFNAFIPERGEFHFHQLHEGCHARIQHHKICPIHGEVSQDEIVSGFEFEPGHYLEIAPEELEALHSEGERTLSIREFISPDQLDARYYDGRMYYLLPDGEAAGEAYAVLQAAMQREHADGIGQATFSGRQQLARVRAVDGMLMMAMLHYGAELETPEAWAPTISLPRPAKKNVDLAVELIRSYTAKEFDFSAYEDDYRQRVQELIDAKRAGRKFVAPRPEAPPVSVNLMDALRESLKRKGGRRRA